MNTDELNFAVFCVESIADKLGQSGDHVHRLLTKDSRILDQYVLPAYDALHTQSKEYIVNDIIEYMREEGLTQ
jgi:type IV secretory pathway TrbF-like protein